jgi:hypothetical protein
MGEKWGIRNKKRSNIDFFGYFDMILVRFLVI